MICELLFNTTLSVAGEHTTHLCTNFYSNFPSGLSSRHAEKLFNQKRYQEAVWMLQKTGDFERAKKLENDIRVRLSTSKIRSIKKMVVPLWEGRISELYFVTLENGLKAIFKPNPEFWTERSTHNADLANPVAEMMASLFSTELNLGMTPITILRTINGMTGSLQAFVDFNIRHEYTWSELRQHSHLLFDHVEAPMAIQKNTMRLFDYLIYNMDRNPSNIKQWVAGSWVIKTARPGEDSGLVLIDQATAFQEQTIAQGRFRPTNPVNDFGFDIKDQHTFYENLKHRLTPQRIRELMNGHFSKTIIQETIARRANILSSLESKFSSL